MTAELRVEVLAEQDVRSGRWSVAVTFDGATWNAHGWHRPDVPDVAAYMAAKHWPAHPPLHIVYRSARIGSVKRARES